ncbi:MAG: sigma-70 family RNA polymerase sigma factor [Bacteroidota bacterium]
MTGVALHKILELLKKGDQDTLEKIYKENRNAFINFSKRYNISKDDAVDIYQDTIIALHENAVNGKINSLNSSISTYLFAIGKYKIFQLLRKNNTVDLNQKITIESTNEVLDVNLSNEKLTNRQKLISKNLEKIGSRCKEVLKLFYYQGYTLDEITVILNYSSKEVLKSQKSRCLKQLKKIIND